MLINARAIVSGALGLIGALAMGETAPAADAEDGRRRLNAMVDRWNTHRLVLPVVARVLVDIVASQAAYTIGTSGSPNINRARPISVDRAGLVLTAGSPDTEVPLRVFTDQEWFAVPNKDLTAPLPQGLWYSRTLPNGTLYPWPIPTDATNDLALYLQTQLTEFADLDTEYDIAPATAEAVEYNLAVRLSAPFGQAVPPDVAVIATNSVADLKRSNQRPVELGMSAAFAPGCGATYDIETDV